jgi:uncharacterized protein
MPSLLEDQRALAAAFMSPAATGGLAVYRSNVYGNWASALAGAYPIVRKIVGEAFFEGMAREYARSHPSTSGDLNEYGGRLAEFLTGFPQTQDLPYLPDVARMEWLVHRAYYAADTKPFDIALFRTTSIEECAALRLSLSPACALLASRWPLGRIWTIHQDDYVGEFAVDLGSGPDRILVHRPRWRVQVRSLAAEEYRFLESAGHGASLGEALEAAVAEDAGFEPSAALARWVDAGVITL